MSFLFCLPFANRASDSGDLYIDFDSNHLIFPAEHLVCQVDALINLFLLEHAYHCISHLAYHAMFCIMLIVHCTVIDCWSFCLCSCLWVEPRDEFVIEEPVEYAYEDQAFVNSENFVGKMTIPSKSLLSLLASYSLFCYAYAAIPTTCLSCLPYC